MRVEHPELYIFKFPNSVRRRRNRPENDEFSSDEEPSWSEEKDEETPAPHGDAPSGEPQVENGMK